MTTAALRSSTPISWCCALRSYKLVSTNGRSTAGASAGIPHKVVGLRLKFVPPPQPGRLTAQVVLRGFGAVPAETTGEASVPVEGGAKELSITLDQPAQVDGQFAYCTVEPWLISLSHQPLQLLAAPEPF